MMGLHSIFGGVGVEKLLVTSCSANQKYTVKAFQSETQISLLTNLQPLVSSNILEWKHWFSIMVGIFRVTNILEGTTLQGSWSSVMLIVQLIVHYWLKLWRDLNHPAPVVRYDNYVIYGDIITCSTSQHSLWTVNRLYCQAQ